VRIVFLGSGAFAIPCFEALVDAGHDLAALITQPDRPRGRGRRLAPPPLKPVALERSIPVLQPRRIRAPEVLAEIGEIAPELQVIVAYGQILPLSVIEAAPRGTVNVHASLLPRYRGAAPIQWAIARGETTTGVTTMLIDEGLDTGPLLHSRALEIAPEETAVELEPRLARLGAGLLLSTVEGLAAGTLTPTPQDEAQASLAPLLRKQDGLADWRLPAATLACRVRGFQPWPGVVTHVAGRGLKILRAEPIELAGPEPGTLLSVAPEGIVVSCGVGSLRLLDVQPESRRPMPAAAFAAGARLAVGCRLGQPAP
jgi:methionyl-tRNA formyltransferase